MSEEPYTIEDCCTTLEEVIKNQIRLLEPEMIPEYRKELIKVIQTCLPQSELL